MKKETDLIENKESNQENKVDTCKSESINNKENISIHKNVKSLINKSILTKEESEVITNELKKLVEQLRNKRKTFRDKSRLLCCGFFSVCMIFSLIIFYIFDVLKYEENCNKNKNTRMEICDAPSISFWTRFFFILTCLTLLIIGLYCTGSTVVVFEPSNNKLKINKKKLVCLPSIREYKLENLSHAYLETDSSNGTPNLSTFAFYSVILVFKTDRENIVNLGLGRDCFYYQEKTELVHNINKYISSIRD